MKIVITGGGTGGHLRIAEVFGKELAKRGIQTLYIGSSSGQDKLWFKNKSPFNKTKFLPSSGVVNKKGVQKLLSLAHIAKLSWQIREDIAKCDGVINVGGYAAAPASLSALLEQKPLFIHEQNAHIGRLNQILRPFAKRFFCSFLPPFDPYPIDEAFFKTARKRTKLKTILFLGGSQGAKAINDFALKIAPILQERGINIIHQTGANDYERVKKEYKEKGIKSLVFAFSDNLAALLNRADFTISRAGASSLWELAANGLPALFVPYPYAAKDHQFFNAKFLADRDAALLCRQNELRPKIVDKIFQCKLEQMSQKLLKLAKPNGTKEIIDEIIKAIDYQ